MNGKRIYDCSDMNMNGDNNSIAAQSGGVVLNNSNSTSINMNMMSGHTPTVVGNVTAGSLHNDTINGSPNAIWENNFHTSNSNQNFANFENLDLNGTSGSCSDQESVNNMNNNMNKLDDNFVTISAKQRELMERSNALKTPDNQNYGDGPGGYLLLAYFVKMWNFQFSRPIPRPCFGAIF